MRSVQHGCMYCKHTSFYSYSGGEYSADEEPIDDFQDQVGLSLTSLAWLA